MKKRDLLTRIEELERRVREVEARPLPVQPPITVPYPVCPTYSPWWGITPPYWRPVDLTPTITCGDGMPTTVSTTVGQVQAWIANPQHGM